MYCIPHLQKAIGSIQNLEALQWQHFRQMDLILKSVSSAFLSLIQAPDELVFVELEETFRSHRNSIFAWVSITAFIHKTMKLNCDLSGELSIMLEAFDHLLMFVSLFPHIEFSAEDLSTVSELLLYTTIKFIHSIPDSPLAGSKLVDLINTFQRTIPPHTSPLVPASIAEELELIFC
jgi:hypothetical protein